MKYFTIINKLHLTAQECNSRPKMQHTAHKPLLSPSPHPKKMGLGPLEASSGKCWKLEIFQKGQGGHRGHSDFLLLGLNSRFFSLRLKSPFESSLVPSAPTTKEHRQKGTSPRAGASRSQQFNLES